MNKSLTNPEAAVVLAKKYGAPKLAAHLNTTRQAIHDWQKRGVPLNRVNDVAKFCGISPAEVIPATARHVSTVFGEDCSRILGELIKGFY